jgi:transposase
VGPPGRPRHTRDLQDLVAYMAQRMDKTTICRLLRVSWEAVARIVIDVVADQLDAAQLDGLFRIGIDEVSYRKGHRYLTVVADHDRDGAVVWAKEGRDAKTLEAFYDELGDQRCAQLEAVSLDMGGAYKKATDARAGQARQCVDPFHLVKLANEAVDKTRRWAWNLHRGFGLGSSRWVKRTRWALLKDPDHLKDSQLEVLHELRRNRSVLYRCWQLKEGVRDLYRLANPTPAQHLDWWLGVGVPQPHPRLRRPLPHRARQPRPHPRRRRTWTVELEARRAQQQDPPHQPPRLRAPLRRRHHRHGLPLLRRDHRRAAIQMTTRDATGDPHEPEENLIFNPVGTEEP